MIKMHQLPFDHTKWPKKGFKKTPKKGKTKSRKCILVYVLWLLVGRFNMGKLLYNTAIAGEPYAWERTAEEKMLSEVRMQRAEICITCFLDLLRKLLFLFCWGGLSFGTHVWDHVPLVFGRS